jgi:hypothetical protein
MPRWTSVAYQPWGSLCYRIIQDRAGLYGLVQYCAGLCTGLHRICAGAPLLYFLLIFVCCPRSCGSSLASVFVNYSALHVWSLFLVILLGVFVFVLNFVVAPFPNTPWTEIRSTATSLYKDLCPPTTPKPIHYADCFRVPRLVRVFWFFDTS